MGKVGVAIVAGLVGGFLVSSAATAPAAADTALVDFTCDVPSGATGVGAGFIPDTVPVDDLEVTVVDTPDPVVSGQPVHFDIDYPVLDPSEGFPPAPEFIGGYGIVRFKFIELTAPIPAGLSGVTAVFQDGAPSWATIGVVGSNIVVRVQSPVPGSYIEVDPDAVPATITIEDSPGHRIPLDSVPPVDIDATASGAPGSTIQWLPPSLMTQIKYDKSLGFLLEVHWNDRDLPCTPNDPAQVVVSTAVVAAEPSLVMAPVETAVAPGETIHYTLGIANQTAGPVTDLALVPGDLTCPTLPSTVAVGTSVPVACSHVARSWEVGTYTAAVELTSTPFPSLTAEAAGVTVAIPPHGFTDVAPAAFYDEAVDYAKFFGLVNGFPGNRYKPGDPLNRGQIVNMLWQMMGQPGGSPAHGFRDVPANAFYRLGLNWAKAEGLVNGFPGNRYKPTDPVNRCQLANMVWQLAGAPTGSPAAGYTDVAGGLYCRPAAEWAKAQGLVTPFAGATRFRPMRAAGRGEVAFVLHQLALTEAAWTDAPAIPGPVLFDPTD